MHTSKDPVRRGATTGSRCSKAVAATVLYLFLAIPSVLPAQGMAVKSLNGAVMYQHPGTAGNPNALTRFLLNLMNRPTSLDTSTALNDGDGVQGDDSGSALQLLCADGATQTLTGRFDALVYMGGDGKQCAITLRAGSVLATTAPNAEDEKVIPTRIVAGDVTLGASTTQFGASIVAGAGTDHPQAEAFVMDGKIEVKRVASTEVATLTSGERLPVGASQAAPIEEATYQRFATTYANLEVMSLPVQQREQARVELQAAYVGALKRPTDVAAQRNLEQVYQARGVQVSPVLIYRQSHINRVQMMNAVPHAEQPPVEAPASSPAAKAATQLVVPGSTQPQ